MVIAVIGLGAAGIVTLKNLREAGLDAIGYDSNTYIGGLWCHSEDETKVSVLSTTVANTSKYSGCFTDFPFPTDVPDYATAGQQARYLERYARNFDLLPFVRLGVRIVHAEPLGNAWKLDFSISGPNRLESLTVDKVVVTCGLTVGKPVIPDIDGADTFSGSILHSIKYHSPEKYSKQRVLVVGLGNTGADIAVNLIGHAREVYLSHSGESVILPRRLPSGAPLDSALSLRLLKLMSTLETYAPQIGDRFSAMKLRSIQADAFGSEIGIEQSLTAPALARKNPVINDHLVPALRSKALSTRPKIASFEGSSVRFVDGTVLEDVDTVIFCTGFAPDFSFLGPSADPTTRAKVAGGRPLPRLYRSIFSLDHPESLAFVGYAPLGPQAYLNFDLSSMAIAQIWAGRSSLPSRSVMAQNVDTRHERTIAYAKTGRLARAEMCNKIEWLAWCDEVSGCGISKRTGFGLEGWKFWYWERPLYDLVVDGILSPHLFRLFDEGKRVAWPGAREALHQVNMHCKR